MTKGNDRKGMKRGMKNEKVFWHISFLRQC